MTEDLQRRAEREFVVGDRVAEARGIVEDARGILDLPPSTAEIQTRFLKSWNCVVFSQIWLPCPKTRSRISISLGTGVLKVSSQPRVALTLPQIPGPGEPA